LPFMTYDKRPVLVSEGALLIFATKNRAA
jgi:hypothetical protein